MSDNRYMQFAVWTDLAAKAILKCNIVQGDDGMSTDEAKRRAKNKYLAEKVESILFRVPKGEKESIQEHAKTQGESTNAFIYRAVKETMQRDAETK